MAHIIYLKPDEKPRKKQHLLHYNRFKKIGYLSFTLNIVLILIIILRNH